MTEYFKGEYWKKEGSTMTTFINYTRSQVENLFVQLAFDDIFELRIR